MYFPNAEVSVHPALLVLLGLIAGTLGGFFGVGGGFLITGGLLVFGVPPVYAVGTGLALVMGTAVINTFKHRRLGNVDFRLGGLMAAGTVPAIFLAEGVNSWLEGAGLAGPVIRYVYVGFLSSLGLFILYDCRRGRGRGDGGVGTGGLARRVRGLRIPPHRVGVPGGVGVSTYVGLPVSGIERISVFVPVGIGFGIGFVAGLLGAGGGFILMPALIYVLGVPTVVAIGTDLFQIIITGSVGTFAYALSDRVDPLMAVLMLGAASAGSQLGAAATRRVEAGRIRFLYGALILSGGLAVGLEEVSVALGLGWLSAAAAVLLLGGGGLMCLLLAGLMRRGRGDG